MNMLLNEHLLLALMEDKDARSILIEKNIDPKTINKKLISYLKKELVDLVNENTKESKPTAGFQRIVQRAALHSQANGQKSINGADVLAEFFFENDSYALTCLKQAHLKRNDILNYNKKINNPGSINEQDILKKQVFPKTKDNSLAISHRLKSQINLEESAPHSAAPSKSPEIELEKYCINLNSKATEDDIDCLIGRQTEIQRTIEILCRRKKNNALLVGESGVGKTAIAEGLAIRIVKGDVPDILKDAVICAPRKVGKNQSVRIRSMQSLTNSIEATIALQEVTNVMKPIEATYQAVTQVKVLSPEMHHNIEADVLGFAEGGMKGDALVSHHSLYRGLSPWHAMRWSLRKLGRSSVFLKEYVGTSQNRQELTNDTESRTD